MSHIHLIDSDLLDDYQDFACQLGGAKLAREPGNYVQSIVRRRERYSPAAGVEDFHTALFAIKGSLDTEPDGYLGAGLPLCSWEDGTLCNVFQNA